MSKSILLISMQTPKLESYFQLGTNDITACINFEIENHSYEHLSCISLADNEAEDVDKGMDK